MHFSNYMCVSVASNIKMLGGHKFIKPMIYFQITENKITSTSPFYNI